MTDPLMTIGAYARAVGLPASALRHYDEVGLLTPDGVDPHTGYRYYSTETMRRAGHIRDLRDAGVPIETMRRVLDDAPEQGAAELRALALRQQDAGARTAALLRRLATELDSPRTTGEVIVDGAALSDAVRAVGLHTASEPPFDLVVLAAEPSGLDVVATNTFTLAAHRHIAPSVVTGRIALRRDSLDVASDWLERQTTVTIALTGDPVGLTGDEGPFQGRLVDASGFPDHLTFLPPATTGEHRALVDRDACLSVLAEAGERVWLGLDDAGAVLAGAAVGHQVVAVDGGRRIQFTTDLLRRALASLPGPRVQLEHTHPHRPCLLTSPVQPNRTVVVMPAHSVD